jgi:hypothetical protein
MPVIVVKKPKKHYKSMNQRSQAGNECAFGALVIRELQKLWIPHQSSEFEWMVSSMEMLKKQDIWQEIWSELEVGQDVPGSVGIQKAADWIVDNC